MAPSTAHRFSAYARGDVSRASQTQKTRGESANFRNLKEAKACAISVEAAMREARHFPNAAARRTSFDALAKDIRKTVLTEFGQSASKFTFLTLLTGTAFMPRSPVRPNQYAERSSDLFAGARFQRGGFCSAEFVVQKGYERL